MTGDIDAAAAEIERRITALRATFRICLDRLEPLEAIGLLGQLLYDSLDRFGTERAGVLDALVAELKRDA